MATATDQATSAEQLAAIRDYTADALHAALGPMLREVVAPMRDAWHAIEDATDEFEDDVALGRRTREIVQAYATRVLDRTVAAEEGRGESPA